MDAGSPPSRAPRGGVGRTDVPSPLRTVVKIPSVRRDSPNRGTAPPPVSSSTRSGAGAGRRRSPGLYAAGLLVAVVLGWMLWPRGTGDAGNSLNTRGVSGLRARTTPPDSGLFSRATASEKAPGPSVAPTTQSQREPSPPRVILADYVIVIDRDPSHGETGPGVH